ncbi:acyl-CoA thioesterase [Streptomyces zagrosensis]|uniref:Acyl-CoA thioester hydrolase n=1 Tax=Streptomyces zagrosensis TaxID=1042984 RepID=A0A7W9QF79_9ACTN|nr:acyl-CoA thioesterase [Streptomyces zagrosensis]MBB5939175.1 acyl-CoA thioester hydrolase [Streptomyces zagrosensis]
MAQPITVPITVRGYETDSQGHLNMSVYVQYAEHARWAMFQAAGISQAALLEEGLGPVNLETTIKYLRELRAGDEVEVTCSLVWGERKTFRIEQTITKKDGTLSAELSSVGGLLDLKERRMVSDPRERIRALATEPHILSL